MEKVHRESEKGSIGNTASDSFLNTFNEFKAVHKEIDNLLMQESIGLFSKQELLDRIIALQVKHGIRKV